MARGRWCSRCQCILPASGEGAASWVRDQERKEEARAETLKCNNINEMAQSASICSSRFPWSLLLFLRVQM